MNNDAFYLSRQKMILGLNKQKHNRVEKENKLYNKLLEYTIECLDISSRYNSGEISFNEGKRQINNNIEKFLIHFDINLK